MLRILPVLHATLFAVSNRASGISAVLNLRFNTSAVHEIIKIAGIKKTCVLKVGGVSSLPSGKGG